MALQTVVSKVILAGNGATTVWPYTFQIPDAASLQVIYTDTTGVQTTLSPSQFSVTGLGTTTGGNVTYPLSGTPIAVGTKLTISRVVDYTQSTVFTNQGGSYPAVIEARFDRVMMAIQQLADRVARALAAPISDATLPSDLPSATARANSILGFDGSGNPFAAALVSGIVSVSTFIQNNLFPAANAAAAQAAIGAAPADAQGADIASAGTINLGAASGNYVKITGTTTITALGTVAAGTKRVVEFTGALLLTHNAVSLILPNNGANITTVAGDTAEFISEGSGNWRCVSYQRATATGVGNTFVLTSNVALSTTAGSPTTVVSTASLPPGNWLILAKLCFNNGSGGNATCTAIISDGTNALAGGEHFNSGTTVEGTILLPVVVTPTVPTTYSLLAVSTAASCSAVRSPQGSTIVPSANDKMTSITAVRLP